MGNRAVILFHVNGEQVSPSIYLQWNGGPESIYAFIDVMQSRYVRGWDVQAATARFIQTVGEFFDTGDKDPNYRGLSLYVYQNGVEVIDIEKMKNLNPGDNGIYAIDTQSYQVRRFVGWDDESFKELTAKQVAKEKREALRDNPDYGTGIAKALDWRNQLATVEAAAEPALKLAA